MGLDFLAVLPSMSLRPLLGLSLLLSLAFLSAAQTDRVTNFALTLRISHSESDRAINELQELMEHAKSKGYSSSLVMLLRSAHDKVVGSLEELAKAEAIEKARAEQKKQIPTSFTNATYAVKPLKAAAEKGKKAGNIVVYKNAKDFQDKYANFKVDLSVPFVIKNAVNDFDTLRTAWTAGNLIGNDEVEIRYMTPLVAKKKRTFDQPQTQVMPEDEQYEHSIINFEKYFRNCFNYMSKPDFKKIPGSDTEHCEQTIPAALIYPNISRFDLQAVSASLGFTRHLDAGRALLMDHAADMAPMVPDNTNMKSYLAKSDTRFLVFGPAGSGEQLRRDRHAFVDGLVHGKRKWFMMTTEKFAKLRQSAKEVLEPGSAFIFFEQQLGELKEEYELGGKGLEFFEVVQEPGDIVFVPGGMIQTSLSLEDAISFKQVVVTSKEDAVDFVNRGLWSPETGVIPQGYLAGVCWGFDFEKIPLGPQLNPSQAALVQQILQQYYGDAKHQNQLILSVIDKCSRQLKARELRLEGLTPCDVVWPACVERLEKNLRSLGYAETPNWLPKSPKPAKEL